MKTKDKNIQHDINKCDLFSLGVILMEAALLKNMDELVTAYANLKLCFFLNQISLGV